MLRADNGHEFQAMFHWHAAELELIHAYIRPASSYLNSKVERSHLAEK